MKPFEFFYLSLTPFSLPLHRIVRRDLLRATKSQRGSSELLDVGGRKSHYTVGVPALVTVTDLPRETSLQKELNLGINEPMIEKTKARRSNIKHILFDDMTCSTLPDNSFNCVVAVEVLEHVEEDFKFVKEVHRVLKPGGSFIMTTPNGDSVRNTNPDHKRHYRRQELLALLSDHFNDVIVEYAVSGGTFRRLGLRSWSLRRPLRTLVTMFSNLINSLQSARKSLKYQANGTRHLIAKATKHH